jgi:acyl-CoA reductase-like NAD-dependent aldehyde dehydrogenase
MPELFIGGEWTSAVDRQVRDIRCPADGSLVATVDEAGPKDAAAAIAAARDAFDRGPRPGRRARPAAAARRRTAGTRQMPQAEWGGMKQSGCGREPGPAGPAEYQEAKHVWRNLSPRPLRWFE